jgi:hypothetical protein
MVAVPLCGSARGRPARRVGIEPRQAHATDALTGSTQHPCVAVVAEDDPLVWRGPARDGADDVRDGGQVQVAHHLRSREPPAAARSRAASAEERALLEN